MDNSAPKIFERSFSCCKLPSVFEVLFLSPVLVVFGFVVLGAFVVTGASVVGESVVVGAMDVEVVDVVVGAMVVVVATVVELFVHAVSSASVAMVREVKRFIRVTNRRMVRT